MNKRIVFISFGLILAVAVFAAACSSGSQPTAENPIQGKVIKSGPINNLTVTLSNDTGKLKSGEQEIMLAFTDASGKAVDVGMVTAAALNFYMPPMGSMAAMNDTAAFTTTSVPGVYRGKVKIQMPGEWQAQISYEGANGSGKTSIPVTAQ
jgi:hypothetical protein